MPTAVEKHLTWKEANLIAWRQSQSQLLRARVDTRRKNAACF